jgi:hypothetical protein
MKIMIPHVSPVLALILGFVGGFAAHLWLSSDFVTEDQAGEIIQNCYKLIQIQHESIETNTIFGTFSAAEAESLTARWAEVESLTADRMTVRSLTVVDDSGNRKAFLTSGPTGGGELILSSNDDSKAVVLLGFENQSGVLALSNDKGYERIVDANQ